MRVTNSPASRKRRNRMLQAAKGFRLKRSKLYRYASDAVDHGRQYAYRDRRVKKRTFRYLWQIRINAAVREAGLTYSRFMEGLKAAKVGLDRKVLADIAATDAAAFASIVDTAKAALKKAAVERFGSGWAWLTVENGKLRIESTSNAETPMQRGVTCLLTVDVWEHAYYLDQQDKRAAYVDAVVDNLLDWERASRRLGEAA